MLFGVFFSVAWNKGRARDQKIELLHGRIDRLRGELGEISQRQEEQARAAVGDPQSEVESTALEPELKETVEGSALDKPPPPVIPVEKEVPQKGAEARVPAAKKVTAVSSPGQPPLSSRLESAVKEFFLGGNTVVRVGMLVLHFGRSLFSASKIYPHLIQFNPAIWQPSSVNRIFKICPQDMLGIESGSLRFAGPVGVDQFGSQGQGGRRSRYPGSDDVGSAFKYHPGPGRKHPCNSCVSNESTPRCGRAGGRSIRNLGKDDSGRSTTCSAPGASPNDYQYRQTTDRFRPYEGNNGRG